MVEWRISDDGTELFILGSNDRYDWAFNFRTRRIGMEGDKQIRVNRMDRYEATVILRSLTPEQRGKLRRIRGHSRGGAIAQIVAYELANVDITLLTYGTKRTGNKVFVRRQQKTCRAVHFRNRGDIVPWLPPWYASMRCTVGGPWQWPWKAHLDYPGV